MGENLVVKRKQTHVKVPEKMKAVIIRKHGGPEVLNIEEIQTPKPGHMKP